MTQNIIKQFSATTSTGNIAAASVYKEVVFNMADTLLEWGETVNRRSTPGLDYRFTRQDTTSLPPQKKKSGSKADYSDVEFYDVAGSLETYQTALMFYDEVKARQIGNIQVTTSVEAAAIGIAQQKDQNISTAITAGAGQTVAATATWDDPVSADPAQDLAEAISDIMINTKMPTTMIPEIKVMYPVGLFGFLSKPVQVGEIQTSVKNFAQDEWKMSFFPTRQLTTDAYVVVKTDQSAIFIEHDGSSLVPVEQYREPGVGDGYLFTQAFDTCLFPSAKGGSTNNYICKITDVNA